MIHTFENNGYKLCLDVNSGSVHMLDDLSFEVLYHPNMKPTALHNLILLYTEKKG